MTRTQATIHQEPAADQVDTVSSCDVGRPIAEHGWKAVLCFLFLIGMSAALAPSAQAQFWFWPEEEEVEDVEVPSTTFFADNVAAMEETIKASKDEIGDIASGLLFLLIALELAVSGAMWGLSRTGIDQLVYRLAIKVFIWGILFAVIANTGVEGTIFNMDYIQRGFRGMAYNVFGVAGGFSGVVYPGDVLVLGFTEAARIFAMGVVRGWWFISFSSMMGALAALITMFGFAIVAIRLWVAIINVVIATFVGLVLLGFAGWRGSAGIADRYVIWVLNASIKLFLLDCIIYIAAPAMGAMYTAAIDEGLLDTLLGAFMWPVISLTFVGLALYLPSAGSRIVTENVSTGLQNAISM